MLNSTHLSQRHQTKGYVELNAVQLARRHTIRCGPDLLEDVARQTGRCQDRVDEMCIDTGLPFGTALQEYLLVKSRR